MLGVELVDRAHGLGVQPGAAVGEVVAGDAGDGGVAQLHRLHRLGDPARLVAVERLGLAGVDLAEVAAPGALVAADEERRLAVLPALEDVGAAGFLADRVQALGLHQVLELRVLRAHLRPGLDPLRLALDRGLGVADLQPQQLAAVGSRSLGHVGQLYAGRPARPNRPAAACRLVTNWLPFRRGRVRRTRRPGTPRAARGARRRAGPGGRPRRPPPDLAAGRQQAPAGALARPGWSTADRPRPGAPLRARRPPPWLRCAALLDRLDPPGPPGASPRRRSTPWTPRYAAPRATGVRPASRRPRQETA